jgi:hypothetical protein
MEIWLIQVGTERQKIFILSVCTTQVITKPCSNTVILDWEN